MKQLPFAQIARFLSRNKTTIVAMCYFTAGLLGGLPPEKKRPSRGGMKRAKSASR